MEITHVSDKKDKYCNCVFYARDKVPGLPYGLTTLGDKKCIINTQDPQEGDVAIMAIGDYGHVGVVKEILSESIIEIKEANYKSCRKTVRNGTEREMSIIGYWSPDPLSNKKEEIIEACEYLKKLVEQL